MRAPVVETFLVTGKSGAVHRAIFSVHNAEGTTMSLARGSRLLRVASYGARIASSTWAEESNSAMGTDVARQQHSDLERP